MDTNKDDTLNFSYGLKIDNVFFGYLDGSLYQLPYNESSGKYIPLRKLRLKVLKSGWRYYHLRRKKYGVEKVRAMLQHVDWRVKKPINL